MTDLPRSTTCHVDDTALAVVVVGMSAGALSALRTLVVGLPIGFPAALVVAYHVAKPTVLPELLRSWTRHPVVAVQDGAHLSRGTIYVCPAEHHVTCNPDATLGLAAMERVNFVRPSVDWLFESAAASFGDRAVAVVLAGANADGARGASWIRRANGVVIAQDPGECEHADMPTAAITNGSAHHVTAARELATVVMARLAMIDFEEQRSRWLHPFAGDQVS